MAPIQPSTVATAVAGRSVRCPIWMPLRYNVSVPPCLVSAQCTQVSMFDAGLFGCSAYSVPFSQTPAYAAVGVAALPGRTVLRCLYVRVACLSVWFSQRPASRAYRASSRSSPPWSS